MKDCVYTKDLSKSKRKKFLDGKYLIIHKHSVDSSNNKCCLINLYNNESTKILSTSFSSIKKMTEYENYIIIASRYLVYIEDITDIDCYIDKSNELPRPNIPKPNIPKPNVPKPNIKEEISNNIKENMSTNIKENISTEIKNMSTEIKKRSNEEIFKLFK